MITHTSTDVSTEVRVYIWSNFLRSKIKMFYKIYNKFEAYYYNVKWTIINFFKYRKIVSRYRPWDSIYILEMIQFQLKQLCDTIEKYGNEIDEDRLPKIADMKRAIELLESQINNDYLERSGYKPEAFGLIREGQTVKFVKKSGYENYDDVEVLKNATKLEEEEWQELFDILKKMRSWWD